MSIASRRCTRSTRLAYTNATPVSAYRGAGWPDIAYAIERLVDYAAHEHGFDPIELRRKNFVPREAMPYKTAERRHLRFRRLRGGHGRRARARRLERISAAAHRRIAAAGKLRGIGIATYLEAGGGGGAPKDQVAVEFDADGEMTLIAVTQSSGQGHETVFPQIVAQTLGIDVAHVRFSPSAPTADLVGNGTGGSRGVLGTGSAFKLLGQKLIEVARPHAAQKLGVREDELRYSEGRYHAGDRSLGFVELAAGLVGTKPHPLNTSQKGSSARRIRTAAISPKSRSTRDTGVATVARYTVVDDLGNVINPTLVEGQVHGGVMQGAGQVFGEHAVYDRTSGQLLTASFSDYFMPRAGMIRDIDVHEHPVPTPTNALGAKGVGEAGCSGSLPALVNATIDALRPLGIAHVDMPLSPARLWAAIDGR